MTLEAAEDHFAAICKRIGLEYTTTREPGQVRFHFDEDPSEPKLYKLFNEVATVKDIKGDPPDCYTLTNQVPLEGTYIKTGTYCE